MINGHKSGDFDESCVESQTMVPVVSYGNYFNIKMSGFVMTLVDVGMLNSDVRSQCGLTEQHEPNKFFKLSLRFPQVRADFLCKSKSNFS